MRRKIFLCALIFFIALFSFFNTTRVIADDSDSPSLDVKNLKDYNFEQSGGGSGRPLHEKNFLGFAIYFGSIVLVCLLAALTLRWLARYTRPIGSKSKYMEILDVLYFDSKNRLYILKSPAGVKLLGVSEKGIELIGELDENTAELIEEAEKSGSYGRNFGVQLEYFLKKFKGLSGTKDGDDRS
nr:MAG: hypothetical protein DIU66_03245 [Bacillota bacterium]